MPIPAVVYGVLIASPGDLAVERQAVVDAINDWNDLNATAEGVVLMPVRWEKHARPQAGVQPQAAINEQLVEPSDILVGMFWTRIGTKTPVAESGTVEEINQFVAAGKPALLYMSTGQIDPNKIDLKQLKKLRDFKGKSRQDNLWGTFESVSELRVTVFRDLTRQVRELKKRAKQQQQQQAQVAAKRGTSLTRQSSNPTKVPGITFRMSDAYVDLFKLWVARPVPHVSAERYRKLSDELKEAQAQIAKLEDQLKGKQEDQALADQLTAFYRAGVSEILNGPPKDITERPAWLEKEAAWTSGVLAIMRESGCTPQELNHVEIIGLFPLLGLHPERSIAKDLSMFAVRLQRVADISTKYAGG